MPNSREDEPLLSVFGGGGSSVGAAADGTKTPALGNATTVHHRSTSNTLNNSGGVIVGGGGGGGGCDVITKPSSWSSNNDEIMTEGTYSPSSLESPTLLTHMSMSFHGQGALLTRGGAGGIASAGGRLVQQCNPWLRKPLHLIANEEEEHHPHAHHSDDGSKDEGQQASSAGLERHLTLFDLVCIGVGSTIGSGIFVLCGLIARTYSGPATFVSWGIAGGAACLSGLCYAELASKIPTAGSVYAYAYVCMGELPAVIAAGCLTLEYVGSASAVARSWGDKIVEWLIVELSVPSDHWCITHFLSPHGTTINPMAFLVSFLSTMLLLRGVRESKNVTNFFTTFNVGLVSFMAIGGMCLMNRHNLSPLVPPEYGVAGVFRGATSSFFGYIGYDEICCVAGEAINPRQNLPRAVMMTLSLVTFLYMTAALALTGMQPYNLISVTSGFPSAFLWNDVNWAAQLTAAGEVFTLPSVVFITLLAQPRLQYALAQDGLLPKFFADIDSSGTLWKGTLVAGTIMTVISTIVPFKYLDDLISAGILVAFTMTDWCLVSLRYDSPRSSPLLLEKLLLGFNVLAFITGFLLSHCWESTTWGGHVAGITACMAACVTCLIRWWCPPSEVLGEGIGGGGGGVANTLPPLSSVASPHEHHIIKHNMHHSHDENPGGFQAPLVPFLPCAGMLMNWYLITQLEFLGILLLLLYLGLGVLLYLVYGAKHSVGNRTGWGHAIGEYESIVR